ncbi:hypothetical protein PR048_012874 [Dryococelus australis]|uniref:Uncharacterized protein n=1 Tax=Dryococelus australis TaxID=614101 RepID=A0ABQ9HQN1_9NEOP|nr:hypothetical protein PR048_012874 [Dryococelus australis]
MLEVPFISELLELVQYILWPSICTKLIRYPMLGRPHLQCRNDFITGRGSQSEATYIHSLLAEGFLRGVVLDFLASGTFLHKTDYVLGHTWPKYMVTCSCQGTLNPFVRAVQLSTEATEWLLASTEIVTGLVWSKYLSNGGDFRLSLRSSKAFSCWSSQCQATSLSSNFRRGAERSATLGKNFDNAQVTVPCLASSLRQTVQKQVSHGPTMAAHGVHKRKCYARRAHKAATKATTLASYEVVEDTLKEMKALDVIEISVTSLSRNHPLKLWGIATVNGVYMPGAGNADICGSNVPASPVVVAQSSGCVVWPKCHQFLPMGRIEGIRDGASYTGKRDWGWIGKESATAFIRDPSQDSPGLSAKHEHLKFIPGKAVCAQCFQKLNKTLYLSFTEKNSTMMVISSQNSLLYNRLTTHVLLWMNLLFVYKGFLSVKEYKEWSKRLVTYYLAHLMRKTKFEVRCQNAGAFQKTKAEFKCSDYLSRKCNNLKTFFGRKLAKTKPNVTTDWRDKTGTDHGNTIHRRNAAVALDSGYTWKAAARLASCVMLSARCLETCKADNRESTAVLFNLNEFYLKFKETHACLKIQFSKFALLRPINNIYCYSPVSDTFCVCMTSAPKCEIMASATVSKMSYKDLMKLNVCDDWKENCML